VLASLWDVDDRATSELMRRFHAEWRAGVDASVALLRAQTALRADPRWAHPTFWAAWQVWGGP
jgi:CHAT domain-containing protein